MNVTRREFGKLAAVSAGSAVLLAGCSAAGAEQTIETILKDLPTVIDIAAGIISMVAEVAAVNPAVLQEVQNAGGLVSAGLETAKTILSQYESNLASAPAGVLGELDAALTSVSSNLQAVLTDVRVLDANTQTAITAIVTGVQSVLLEIFSLLPGSLAARMPLSSAALHKAAVSPRRVSGRALAKEFNATAARYHFRTRVRVPALVKIGMVSF